MDYFLGRRRRRTADMQPTSEVSLECIDEAHDAIRRMHEAVAEARANLQGALDNLRSVRRGDHLRR